MVVGIDKFKEYFKEYADNYIIIGGTACDIIIGNAGFVPRATQDFDIILIVEALKPDFVKRFWEFIKAGKYEQQEKNPDERKYYRFLKPEDKSFPKQVELFTRVADLLDLEDDAHLAPIPVDDNISSLSAILMNDVYYHFTLEHAIVEEGVHIANIGALICLKVKAFLDMSEMKEKGEEISTKNIRKHKTDVFRLAVMLTAEDKFNLPESIKKDMAQFIGIVKGDLPDKAIFREMGLGTINPETVLNQIIQSFQL
jgi:hypothetical protein